VNEIHQILGLVVAYVVDFIIRRVINHPDYTVYYIVYICKISLHVAIIEDFYGTVFQY